MLLSGDSYGGVQSAELAMQGQQAQNYWNTVKTMQADAQFAKQVADQQRARDLAQQNLLAETDTRNRMYADAEAGKKEQFDWAKLNENRNYALSKSLNDWRIGQPKDENSVIAAMNMTAGGMPPDQAALAFNLPDSVVSRLALVHNAEVKKWNDAIAPAQQLADDLNRNASIVSTFDQLKEQRLATKPSSFWQSSNKDAIKQMDADILKQQSKRKEANDFIVKFGENNKQIGLQGGRYVPLTQSRAFWTMPGANAPGAPGPSPSDPRNPFYPDDQNDPDFNGSTPSPTPPPASPVVPSPVGQSALGSAPAVAGGTAPFAWRASTPIPPSAIPTINANLRDLYQISMTRPLTPQEMDSRTKLQGMLGQVRSQGSRDKSAVIAYANALIAQGMDKATAVRQANITYGVE